jgi:hypothetical protein
MEKALAFNASVKTQPGSDHSSADDSAVYGERFPTSLSRKANPPAFTLPSLREGSADAHKHSWFDSSRRRRAFIKRC